LVEVRSSFPIVYVDDVPASVRFYRDLLGFEEMYRFPETDEPGYVALRLDDGKIGLSSAEFPGIHGKPQRPVTGRPFELSRRGPGRRSGTRTRSGRQPKLEIRAVRNSRKRSASISTAA
jgi:catechol 2,3-dioxygenase-like lactoylglutathione lyase family enzyme